MMRFLSLFAGIGGFDLGLERAGMTCAGQVEINLFCQRVLACHWPDVMRVSDIREVNGYEFKEIDLICGGVPCQPASCAGKRRGTQDDRWLWPEALRVVSAIRPSWLLFENVRGLTSLEQGVVFDNLLTEMEDLGYEVQPLIIPACGVDAPHRRDRVWIVAHTWSGRFCGSGGIQEHRENKEAVGETSNSSMPASKNVAHSPRSGSRAGLCEAHQEQDRDQSAGGGLPLPDAHHPGREEQWRSIGEQAEHAAAQQRCWWLPEPRICRVAHGIPGRVDRLRSLGNAVVPQIVEQIGRAILTAEERCITS